MRERLAIVLFNLGGPDRPEAVAPFLLNLFKDPAILRVPFFVRPFLARLIAKRRTPSAVENYAILGGKSPLLELTEAQGRALEASLADAFEARAFVAMRYWHPFSAETVKQVQAFRPDRVMLLPLYPQFSTTTTGSSLDDWQVAAVNAGLVAPVTALCCWYDDPGFVVATTAMLRHALDEARSKAAAPLRVLFSAHGLPESIVKAGDPYQLHVERCVAAVLGALDEPGLDSVICYQSRVTPEPWLSPSTDAEIGRAGRDRVAVLVVPIAFISEHSETLVELDVDYRRLADGEGVPGYFRAPAQNSDPGFIAALDGLVRRSLARGPGLCSRAGGRLCPAAQSGCPQRITA